MTPDTHTDAVPNRPDTVAGRLARARLATTPGQVLLAVALAGALFGALVALQTPLAHDSLHGFRHAAGIVCH